MVRGGTTFWGIFFMIESGYVGIEFSNSYIFRIYNHGLFVKIHLLVSFLQHFRIYGYDFHRMFGFMGGTFTAQMAQSRILETQVTPTPRPEVNSMIYWVP